MPGKFYYIPLSKENIKLEKFHDQRGQEFYRLWINEKVVVSSKFSPRFILPVMKKRTGKIYTYEVLEAGYKYLQDFLVRYWDDQSAFISISEVKRLNLEENPKVVYNILYSNDFQYQLRSNFQIMIPTQDQRSLDVQTSIYLQKFQKIVSIENVGLLESETFLFQDLSTLSVRNSRPSVNQLSQVKSLLESVGLTDEQMTALMTNLGLSAILDGEPLPTDSSSGVLLYGPAGTGKSTTMNLFFEVFRILGCNVHQVEGNTLVSKAVVGGFATQVYDEIFRPAIDKITQNSRPCFIYVDEGTSLVTKPDDNSVSQWYGEGLDTIKNFTNRNKFPGIILCIATNAEKKDLDNAIVGGSGRLKPIYYGPLNKKQLMTLWNLKLKSNLHLPDDVLKEWDKNGYIEELSTLCDGGISGRFIAHFCSSYRDNKLNTLSWQEQLDLRSKGINLTQKFRNEQIDYNLFLRNFCIAFKQNLESDYNDSRSNIGHFYSKDEQNEKLREIDATYGPSISRVQDKLNELDNRKSDIKQEVEVDNTANLEVIQRLREHLNIYFKMIQKIDFENLASYISILNQIRGEVDSLTEIKGIFNTHQKAITLLGINSYIKLFSDINNFSGDKNDFYKERKEDFETLDRMLRTSLLSWLNKIE